MIKILSNNVINKIAAGEVIERPASVVKELLENSIDAGAKLIQIILERAGKNLIVISDNGVGMTKEELLLSVKRHATSKLDENNLMNIKFFGFRGEALPSIGAVSKLKITTKTRDLHKAYSLSIIGGKQQELTTTLSNTGTVVEVSDLFFATPARLKFLRTDRTEFNAVIDCIKKIALSKPDIKFRLVHNNKEIFNYKVSDSSKEKQIKQRIRDILGIGFLENALPINLENNQIRVYGFCSLPTFHRASMEDQFLFVNNRPIKDKVLNLALKLSYQDFLVKGRYAVCVLFIDIDPILVDVNVHPSKTEVRFFDPVMVRAVVINGIKSALSNCNYRVASTISNKALDYIQSNEKNNHYVNDDLKNIKESLYNQVVNSKDDNNLVHNNNNNIFSNEKVVELARTQDRDMVFGYNRPDYNLINDVLERNYVKDNGSKDNKSKDNDTVKKQGQNYDLNNNHYPLGFAKAQLYKNYIISQTKDNIIIVDQHAAHERIVYEKIKSQLANNGLIKQRLLIAEIIEMPDNKRAELIEEYKKKLSNLGLTVKKFGEKSIIVSEVPSLIGDVNIINLIQDIADYLVSEGDNVVLSRLIEHVTETYACHYSIRSGRKLLIEEMNELLRQIEKTPNSGQCNHGRPTYIMLKLNDIEKLFGRT